MSRMTAKTYTTEVICLRATDFGEADRILQLYSPEHGRISAIAKGVKKQKSKLSGACELLNISTVQLSKGKNLDLLCQYQPQESFPGLRTDLLRLAYGMLFAELLLYTATDTEEDSEAFYGLIKEGLRLLQACPEDGVVAFALQYQLQWLESAGYHPVLDACLYTGEPLDDSAVYYCFSPSLGGIATPAQKKRLQESSGVAHSEWVNVSTSTLRLLREPTGDWSWEQRLKAQRFLRYYFSRAFERNLRAYELVLNLLTPAATASADLQSREVALEPTQV